jgi:hypothetical protein
VLCIEKLHDIKRILNIDFSDLVRILETEDKFTSEVKQQLESWYKDLADSSMQDFTKFYDESIPELPEVYHERATFVWQDLASAHCCLGDKLFEDPQDDEAPCSIKPLAQPDPEIVQSKQDQNPLPAYSVGAGNDEAFVITDTATRQSGLVAKQWSYGCRADDTVPLVPKLTESYIDIATETDRAIMWCIFLIMSGFQRLLTLAVTLEDKVAITGTVTRLQTRVTRLRTEITALAQEAGMDVTSRLEDFQF